MDKVNRGMQKNKILFLSLISQKEFIQDYTSWIGGEVVDKDRGEPI